jgi:hypothetical protein
MRTAFKSAAPVLSFFFSVTPAVPEKSAWSPPSSSSGGAVVESMPLLLFTCELTVGLGCGVEDAAGLAALLVDGCVLPEQQSKKRQHTTDKCGSILISENEMAKSS